MKISIRLEDNETADKNERLLSFDQLQAKSS